MSNSLEIIIQNQSFTTDDLSTDLQFETAQKVCDFLDGIYLFLRWHGPNWGRIWSGPPSILVVYANGAPWCCKQRSPACVLHCPSGSTQNPASPVWGWISFSLFIPCLLLHCTGQYIHLHHSSLHSVNTYEPLLRVGTFTDAGNAAMREPDMAPTPYYAYRLSGPMNKDTSKSIFGPSLTKQHKN